MLRRDPAEAFAEADSSPVDPANYLKVSQLHRSDGDSTSGAAAGGLKLASRYIHEILGIPQFSHSFSNFTVRSSLPDLSEILSESCHLACHPAATQPAVESHIGARNQSTAALSVGGRLSVTGIRQRRRA